MNEQELLAQIEKLRKEKQVLDYKLQNSIAQRRELEEIMAQTRSLLEKVSAERLTEEKKKQLQMFVKFVPMEFLKSLSKESTLDITLGDYVERQMTVLFSDIFSFTTLSESMTPSDNFKFVNAYLRHVEPPIHLNSGFIDKFIGDGIMALFYQAQNAIEAAIQMQKSLTEYNQTRAKHALVSIKMGIGVHTGNLMLGIIGVEERMQSTVIADAVNLAARIEGLTRQYDANLLTSQETLSQIDASQYNTRFLGKICVVGKVKVIEIFEILNAESEEICFAKTKGKTAFQEALTSYFKKDFKRAIQAFKEALKFCPQDRASQLYIEKCKQCLEKGVPAAWDGILRMLSK